MKLSKVIALLSTVVVSGCALNNPAPSSAAKLNLLEITGPFIVEKVIDDCRGVRLVSARLGKGQHVRYAVTTDASVTNNTKVMLVFVGHTYSSKNVTDYQGNKACDMIAVPVH